MDPIWLGLGFLIIISVAGWVMITRRREARGLRELAAGRGLSFSSEDLIGIQDRYHNLEMIRQGHNRHACNVLYGPTAEGLVTVFSYHYELGFGAQRVGLAWWLAVVETPGAHEHWRAVPADSSEPPDGTPIGRFCVRADHERTLVQLKEAGVEKIFATAPPDYHWEVRGSLVAAAAPFHPDPQKPGQLLDAARDLARRSV